MLCQVRIRFKGLAVETGDGGRFLSGKRWRSLCRCLT